MVVHAAFGGSTNLLLHIPAIAHAAGLPRPTVDDWNAINTQVPRLVDVLPNGPIGHPTCASSWPAACRKSCCICASWACCDLDCLTVTGETLGEVFDWWETVERRAKLP